MHILATRPAWAIAVAGLVTFTGCATARPPTQAQADAAAAIDAAGRMGAAQEPRAARHLAFAQDQMRVANQRIGEGEMREAERLLRQAEADASAALSLAREHRTRETAAATLRRIEEMRAANL